MASTNPASRRERAKELLELFPVERKFNEELLASLKLQNDEYDQSVEKLKQISLQKQLINATQEKLTRNQQTIDSLETNILKRNNDIIKTEATIEHLKSKVLSASTKSRVYGKDELSTMLAFGKIYGKFTQEKERKLDAERRGIAYNNKLTLQELAILDDVAKMKNTSLTNLLKQTGTAARLTHQQMIQAQIQQRTNDLQKNRLFLGKEEEELRKKQKEESVGLIQNWFESNALVTKGRDILSGTTHVLRAMGIPVTNLVKLFSGPWLAGIGASVLLLTKAFELFQELDKAAFEARKEMGMMRDTHDVLRKQAEGLYKDYAHLGVTVDQVYKAQKAISMELGSTHAATKEIVTQVSLMQAQFGIAEETSVQFLKTMAQMGNTTAEAQTNMVGFAGALSNAAGIPLSQVMGDVAKASETTRTMMSKTPMDMIKAAVEARRLGTTLDKMASSSRKLLNFSESISDEMEASVMLGKPINLQLARQLAYSGKIEESNKKILDIAKDVKFEQLDPLTMESFAKATGKSVDELKSMLQADREQLNIKRKAAEMAAKGDLSLQKQLDTVNELKAANAAAAKASGENYLNTLKQQANQERMVQISNMWKKIMVDLTNRFLPLVDGMLTVVTYGMNFVEILTSISRSIGTAVLLGKQFKGIFGTALKSLGKMTGVLNILFAVVNVIKSIYTGISRIGDALKKGDWWGAIGAGGKMVLGIIAGITEGFFGFVVDISILILKGLGAVGVGWAKAAGEWADSAWNALKDWFGFSPSKIGLLIVKGISSIGSLLFDSLTAPFRRAWDWISNLFSSKKIQPTIEKPIVDSKNATTAIPVDKPVNDNTVKSYRELNDTTTESNVTKTNSTTPTPSTSDTTMQALLEEIKGLRSDLTAGKIAVNLDGQLISTNMNRGIKFRGQYGAIV